MVRYYRKMENVFTCKVKDIPTKINEQKESFRIERSGVIVYTIYNNKYYFGLGIDHDSGDITDFGGGIKKKDHSLIDGTLRELAEESLGVFGRVTPNEIDECVCVYNQNTMVVFIPLIVNKEKVMNVFKHRLKYVKEPEVDSIFWITKETFINLIYGKKVYDKYDNKQRLMYNRIRSVFINALKKKNFITYL